MMPSGAVIVWRDVKHSTSAWRGGGKNTHDQSGEAEVTILMIYLLRWSFKVEDIVGCTHWLVEVEELRSSPFIILSISSIWRDIDKKKSKN